MRMVLVLFLLTSGFVHAGELDLEVNASCSRLNALEANKNKTNAEIAEFGFLQGVLVGSMLSYISSGEELDRALDSVFKSCQSSPEGYMLDVLPPPEVALPDLE